MLTRVDVIRLRSLYAILGVGCIAVLCGAPDWVIMTSCIPGAVYFVYALLAFIQEQMDTVRQAIER